MRTFINQLGNLIMKPLLRSPLHFFVSSRILLITFTGRKSHKSYTTPTEYHREGETVKLFTQKDRVWWKNLQNNAPVEIRLQGNDRSGTATVPILDTLVLHSE